MTDLVKSLKIGNNSYAIKDEKAVPYMSADDEIVFNNTGTYRGQPVTEVTRFVKEDGTVEEKCGLPVWSPATLPSVSKWISVVYGGGNYVAVSTNTSNSAAYSADGVTWSSATLPSSATWRDVCYGNGKFVTVSSSNSNAAAYSTDGTTWTASSLPSTGYWTCLAYGNGKFIAINEAKAIAYSTDGTTWTASQSTAPSIIHDLVYGDDKFVATSYQNTKVYYSTDGETWTETNLPSGYEGHVRSITYGGGKFVIVSTETDKTFYSSDGITWNESTMPTKTFWRSVAYGNGMFVAVDSTSDKVAYSYDGINWSLFNSSSSNGLTCVCYGGCRFVAVQYNTNVAAVIQYNTSSSSATIPSTSITSWINAVHGSDKYLATGYVEDGSNTYIYSLDGKTWTSATVPDTVLTMLPVLYGNGKFVLLGGNPIDASSLSAAISDDGINWDVYPVYAGLLMEMQRAIFDGSNFVGVGYGGEWFKSSDGIEWLDGTIFQEGYTCDCIAYGNGTYITLSGDNGVGAVSTDGETWTEINLPSAHYFSNIAYGNGLFVAASGDSTDIIYSSNNGSTWSTGSLPLASGSTAADIIFANGLFVVSVANSNKVLYSSNAIDWEELTVATSGSYILCNNGTDFVGLSYDNASSGVFFSISQPFYSNQLSYTKAEIDSKGYLQNTATGSNSLTLGSSFPSTGSGSVNIGIGSTTTSQTGAVAIGYNTSAQGWGVALGNAAKTTGNVGIAIGSGASATGVRATVIGDSITNGAGSVLIGGRASNTEAHTFKVSLNSTNTFATDESGGLYTLLDSSGNIPTGRMGNVYEVVQTMPASPTSGKIYFLESGTAAPIVVETYSNGTSWYRLWSDGWCEQGGETYIPSNMTKVYLNTPFPTTNYTLALGGNDPDDNVYVIATAWYSKATDGFAVVSGLNNHFYAFTLDWYACGYVS